MDLPIYTVDLGGGQPTLAELFQEFFDSARLELIARCAAEGRTQHPPVDSDDGEPDPIPQEYGDPGACTVRKAVRG